MGLGDLSVPIDPQALMVVARQNFMPSRRDRARISQKLLPSRAPRQLQPWSDKVDRLAAILINGMRTGGFSTRRKVLLISSLRAFNF